MSQSVQPSNPKCIQCGRSIKTNYYEPLPPKCRRCQNGAQDNSFRKKLR